MLYMKYIDDKNKAKVVRRLKLLEGQVRGLQRMVENDTYCIDVITQTSAVKQGLSNVEDMLELPIIAVIPEDKNVIKSVVMKNALVYTHPKSKASRAYKKLAARLIGKEDYQSGFWERLFG